MFFRKKNTCETDNPLALRIPLNPHTSASILRGYGNGVNFWNARLLVEQFNSQNGTSVRLISPHNADAIQTDKKKLRILHERLCLFFFTDAFIAYETPGIPLEKEVLFTEYDGPEFSGDNNPRVIMQTGRYAGSKGIALFIADVTTRDLKRGKKEIFLDVPDTRIQVIEDFPPCDGLYYKDPVTTIPREKKPNIQCRPATSFGREEVMLARSFRANLATVSLTSATRPSQLAATHPPCHMW